MTDILRVNRSDCQRSIIQYTHQLHSMVRTYLYSQIYRQWRIQWGETVQMHPLQKIQKKSFLPIFEGFWAYRPWLCVSYY